MLIKLSEILVAYRILLFTFLTQCLASALVNRCSNCLYGADYCNPATGQCTYGCNPGWVPPSCTNICSTAKCQECIIRNSFEECTRCRVDTGMYGPLCNLRCNDHCKGEKILDKCDHYGNCLYGCIPPYIGQRCEDQVCPFPNCDLCAVNYHGSTYCQRCVEGYFWNAHREQCVKCSIHCLNPNYGCDVITGSCRSGMCQPNWFGATCDSYCSITNCTSCGKDGSVTVCNECAQGQYPSSDKRSCVSCNDRHCKNNDCYPKNGNCLSGCEDKWFGEGQLCDRECYFPKCSECQLNFNKNSICSKCESGYYSQNQVCEECPANCQPLEGIRYCKADGHCTHGCSPGFYGNLCVEKCSVHCLNKSCNSIGSCECELNWYGRRCDRSCPIHCINCGNYVNQTCQSCEPGWYGTTCDNPCNSDCRPEAFSGYIKCDKDSGHCNLGCSVGSYGPLCDKKCNQNCDGDNCAQDTGVCLIGCSLYYYGEKCDQHCPSNCGSNTNYPVRRCDTQSGTCTLGCVLGYYGDYCNKSCHINCKENKCDMVNGDCVLGCKLGFSGKKCEDVCKPNCPNECSPNCVNNDCDATTKSCIFGCNVGWYGVSCDDICSQSCQDRVCKQLTGECRGQCVTGKYGPECEYKCGVNCVDRYCNKTGYCTRGCEINYNGPSYHGANCENVCSENCRNGTCDQKTGKCHSCGLGRHGDFCDIDCLPGYYGYNCELQCGHCKDYSACYINDGRCPVGCEVGWTGLQCTQALQTSYSQSTSSDSVEIAAGCSVAALFCCIMVVALLCWFKRKRRLVQKGSELVVVYRDAQATIETVHQPSTSVILTSNSFTNSYDSNISNTPLLLGDMSGGSQISLGDMIHKGEFYNIHKGVLLTRGQQEDCCLKIAKLQDLSDQKTTLGRLLQMSEMLSLCGCHSNITRLITTYQNTGVYCVALDNCIQTDLLSYLQELESSACGSDIEPDHNYKILQFTIDVCSGVCHIHKLKIKHRALQAGHVYLSDTLVAKIGDFDWAEREKEDSADDSGQGYLRTELPEDFYSWLAPESLVRNEFTYQSDIWCLGLLFWEIFTLGKAPYEGLQPEDHRQAVMDGIRPAKPYLAHFTLYRVMKNCWRYDSDDRPTPDQILQQLLDFQGRFTATEKIVVHV